MWRRHVCYACKRSVCGGDEPQPVAHLSHKLQCARQSLKIMVSYGNKYPRHNAQPHVVEQSGQCARALHLLIEGITRFITRSVYIYIYIYIYIEIYIYRKSGVSHLTIRSEWTLYSTLSHRTLLASASSRDIIL